MNQKRVYKTYTQEFKKEAVALVTDQGYSVAEAARSLGVNTNLLYKWKEQQEAQASGAALSTDEREELKKLRAENKRLRMEKDILKKASAFFAREMSQALSSFTLWCKKAIRFSFAARF